MEAAAIIYAAALFFMVCPTKLDHNYKMRGEDMIWFMIGLSVFLMDLKIKNWAERTLPGKEKQPIGKTGFSLKLVHNRGFAKNRLDHKPELVKWIHGAVLLMIGSCGILMGGFRKGRELTSLGMALILGGGTSNFCDRIKRGHVTDYLGLPVAKHLIFNLSDLCIFAGGIFVALGELKN